VVPRGTVGLSTVDNSKLACAFHDQVAARQVHCDDLDHSSVILAAVHGMTGTRAP
jgi:hypothetical protein